MVEKRLGCLHAHYSNIEYIENALSPYDIECIHFVDPGLMERVLSDDKFEVSDAQKKAKDQIEWIARCNVDAILITCTNYIAILQDEKLSISVPIINIDEPYFECICKIQQPQTILFTNASTVNGTIERLKQFAYDHKKAIDIEVMVINNTFDLIMKGLKEQYNQEIIKSLKPIIKENKIVSVGQLSMVDASKEVQQITSKPIINPLDPLISYILKSIENR